ncbi:MAG: flagellar basal-body rod protein FlgG [Gammaproteobacteria bacterium]|nr:flagellar basal-body rod protein FlgG [Gammaproteobacteria bacterium]
MTQSLWVGKTGLDAQQTRLSIISNNLANASTTGYKRDRALFEDLLYQNVRQAGSKTSEDTELPSGLSLGTGVKMVATNKIHTQGNVLQTQNTYDMAIQGYGYFQVLHPNGNMSYSRNGEFHINGQGEIVNSSGYRLQPQVVVPPDAMTVSIGKDGTVSITQPGNPELVEIGQITLTMFQNPAGLAPIGENLFFETAASGAPQIGVPGENGMGTIHQGSLEGSNVNVVEELVNMIETQRAYEMNSKAIATMDQMLQYLNNNT